MSLVYGVNAVGEALKVRRVSRLIHVRGAGPRVDTLVTRAQELRIPVETIDRLALDRMARDGVHQGVAAEMQPLPAFTVEELVREAAAVPLLVVLDSVEDPQNVGAILRSVDAAGADGVIRQARHAARIEGAAAKASAGAVNHRHPHQILHPYLHRQPTAPALAISAKAFTIAAPGFGPGQIDRIAKLFVHTTNFS